MPKVIEISGVIGGYGLEGKDIRKCLDEAEGEDIRVEINSPGGYVMDGLEIFNLLKNYPGKVHAHVMGYAMSMASYIPLAADTISSEENTIWMIHNPMGGVLGADYREAQKFADHMEKMAELLARKYAEKTGKSVAEVRADMDAETFLYGEESLHYGLSDEMIISDPESSRAENRDDAIAYAGIEYSEMVKKIKAEKKKTDPEKLAAFFDPETMEETEPDEMPYPNEHACRVREPSEFQSDSFRRISRESDGKKFDIIIGRLKGKTSTTTQAYRYPKKTWTAADAKAHCKRNDGKTFEPASGQYDPCGIENITGTNPASAGKNNKEAAMDLTQFLAENPAANAEYKEAIADAEKRGAEAVENRVDLASKFLTAESEYPESITNLAVKVVKGEQAEAALTAAVAAVDAIRESEKSKAAKTETVEQGNTPASHEGSGNPRGEIKTDADFAASQAAAKKELGIEGV